MIKICTLKGWWFSFGVHVDLKHRHVDIHFVWWIIILGNTKESIHCGECGRELKEGSTECEECGAIFDETTLADCIAEIIEDRRVKILENPNDPSWTEHFAELQNEIRLFLRGV